MKSKFISETDILDLLLLKTGSQLSESLVISLLLHELKEVGRWTLSNV